MSGCGSFSKRHVALVVLLVVAGLAINSCGIQFRGRAPQDEREGEEAVDRADPFADPGDKVIATAVDIGLTDYSLAEYDSLTPGYEYDTGEDEAVITGYDVQYFASLNIIEAREVKRHADSLTTMPIRILFEEPYYKVVAGPYPELAPAERFLQQVIKLGYSSAWIISHREESGE